MLKTSIVAVITALVLAGCGTRYQEMGFTGGVAAERVTADTWRIKARGNAYTDETTVQDYVMLKAAETTQAAGGTHFLIVGANDATKNEEIVFGGHANTTVVGNQAFTTYSPPSVSNLIKPGQDVYIRVLKLAPGQQAQ